MGDSEQILSPRVVKTVVRDFNTSQDETLHLVQYYERLHPVRLHFLPSGWRRNF